jgi:hypothetical protein
MTCGRPIALSVRWQGVSELDMHLLMNHSLPGVNAGYVTRHRLLGDHLRKQQQAISSTVVAAIKTELQKADGIRHWLTSASARQL